MGKPTGFLEYERVEAKAVSPKERIKNFNEFHTPLSEAEQRCQSARCMDCGVPFCQSGMNIKGMTSGCPLNTLIPEWNDLVYTGNWEQAWNGIVDMFKGIFNLIPTIVEGIINGAIAIINGIIWGINQLTGAIGIPAIPEIPNVSLPRFHTGGIVDFAMGEGPALLKDGEMVLTQKQQAELFALANGNYSDAANSSVIVVNSPLYLDGKLITDNVTKHQYNDVMAKRYKG